MSLSKQNVPFTDDYREQCFNAWVLAGSPSATQTQNIIPDHVDGRRPSIATINNWMETYAWKLRAEEINAAALAKVNEDLVSTKADLLREQFQNSVAIAKKAMDALLTGGFDSSNAAVQAYFRATAEARTVMGISELMQKVGQMTDKQLQDAIAENLERLAITDAIPLDEESNVVEQAKEEYTENKSD